MYDPGGLSYNPTVGTGHFFFCYFSIKRIFSSNAYIRCAYTRDLQNTNRSKIIPQFYRTIIFKHYLRLCYPISLLKIRQRKMYIRVYTRNNNWIYHNTNGYFIRLYRRRSGKPAEQLIYGSTILSGKKHCCQLRNILI